MAITPTSIENRIGYLFADRSLLRAALTHPSAINGGNPPWRWETLEHLGDAVLDLAATHWLLDAGFPREPGVLTQARQLLVCNASLARLARDLDLHFAIYISTRSPELRYRRSVLADAFEALIGAVYLDAHQRYLPGGPMVPVRRVVDPLLEARCAESHAAKALRGVAWTQ